MKPKFYLSKISNAIALKHTSFIHASTSSLSQTLLQSMADHYPFTWEEINHLHTQTGKDLTITEKLLTYAAKHTITIEEAIELHLYLNYLA